MAWEIPDLKVIKDEDSYLSSSKEEGWHESSPFLIFSLFPSAEMWVKTSLDMKDIRPSHKHLQQFDNNPFWVMLTPKIWYP